MSGFPFLRKLRFTSVIEYYPNNKQLHLLHTEHKVTQGHQLIAPESGLHSGAANQFEA